MTAGYYRPPGWDYDELVQKTAMLVWDTGSLSWIKATGGSGAGTEVEVTNFPSTFGATQSGTWNITNVSGTLSLPTGASTAARQDTGNTSLASIDGKITAVNTGAVTVTVSALPSGASTESTLAALNAKVTAVNTGAVVVASGSLTANAGTNLNTSALALEAGHLATIDTSTARIPAQGQALAAASMPVVLTAAQITTLTPPAAIVGFALESGGNLATIAGKDFATSAKQDTGNTSLATISTNTASLVTAQSASSTGVTGPLVQAVVSDVPSSFLTDTVQPLSLTADGRLRVSTVMSQMDQVWRGTFTSPWFSDSSWLESKGEIYV